MAARRSPAGSGGYGRGDAACRAEADRAQVAPSRHLVPGAVRRRSQLAVTIETLRLHRWQQIPIGGLRI
jgi:hypothetical protein